MERDKTKRIMVRFEEPYEMQAMLEPDMDPSSAELGQRSYRVETTFGEAEDIEQEIYETADEALQHAEIDGIILDAERYAKLEAYYHDRMQSAIRPGSVAGVDSRWEFPIFAVHVNDAEVCEAVYNNAEKMAEAFIDDR